MTYLRRFLLRLQVTPRHRENYDRERSLENVRKGALSNGRRLRRDVVIEHASGSRIFRDSDSVSIASPVSSPAILKHHVRVFVCSNSCFILKNQIDRCLILPSPSKRKTLFVHELADDLQSQPAGPLTPSRIYFDQVKVFEKSSNQKLMKWMNPLAQGHALYTFSVTL